MPYYLSIELGNKRLTKKAYFVSLLFIVVYCYLVHFGLTYLSYEICPNPSGLRHCFQFNNQLFCRKFSVLKGKFESQLYPQKHFMGDQNSGALPNISYSTKPRGLKVTGTTINGQNKPQFACKKWEKIDWNQSEIVKKILKLFKKWKN